eukprot:jgi/Chrzof1/7496/Cz02g25310.t1
MCRCKKPEAAQPERVASDVTAPMAHQDQHPPASALSDDDILGYRNWDSCGHERARQLNPITTVTSSTVHDAGWQSPAESVPDLCSESWEGCSYDDLHTSASVLRHSKGTTRPALNATGISPQAHSLSAMTHQNPCVTPTQHDSHPTPSWQHVQLRATSNVGSLSTHAPATPFSSPDLCKPVRSAYFPPMQSSTEHDDDPSQAQHSASVATSNAAVCRPQDNTQCTMADASGTSSTGSPGKPVVIHCTTGQYWTPGRDESSMDHAASTWHHPAVQPAVPQTSACEVPGLKHYQHCTPGHAKSSTSTLFRHPSASIALSESASEADLESDDSRMSADQWETTSASLDSEDDISDGGGGGAAGGRAAPIQQSMPQSSSLQHPIHHSGRSPQPSTASADTLDMFFRQAIHDDSCHGPLTQQHTTQLCCQSKEYGLSTGANRYEPHAAASSRLSNSNSPARWQPGRQRTHLPIQARKVPLQHHHEAGPELYHRTEDGAPQATSHISSNGSAGTTGVATGRVAHDAAGSMVTNAHDMQEQLAMRVEQIRQQLSSICGDMMAEVLGSSTTASSDQASVTK